MKRLVALLLCVCVGARVAHADDASDAAERARAAALRAQPDVDAGLAALAAGRADEAVAALRRAVEALPDDPVLHYDLGVALERAGTRDEALKEYAHALRLEGATGDVGARALYNTGTLQLAEAAAAEQLLRDPAAAEAAVRAQGSPDGNPLTDDMARMLADKLRQSAAERGVKAAGEAAKALRDVVRRDVTDADAARNLVLANRTRRYLKAELEKLQEEQRSQQQQKGEQGDESEQQQDASAQQSGDGQQQDAQEAQQQEGGTDQQQGADTQQAQQETGDEGAHQDDAAEPAAAEGDTPHDVGREEAERLLQKLLDAAAQKSREVERLRLERLRRTPVGKDW